MIALLLLSLLVASPVRPQVGDPAPAFQAQTLAGQSVRSVELRGHVTVVDFFASWCEPCQEGLSEMLAVRRKLGSRFDLMVVAVEGDAPVLRDFFVNHPLPAGTTVALDRDGALVRAFGEDRLPTTFFLDDQAIIRHINRGHGSGFPARAVHWLTELLGK